MTLDIQTHVAKPNLSWKASVNDYLLSSRRLMINESAYVISHQCLSISSAKHRPSLYVSGAAPTLKHICTVCVHVCSVDSLIPRVAGVGEGLQLDSRLCHSIPSLGFNDSPVNVLLQVDKAPVVAERHPGWNVVVLYEKGVPDSVCTHDIVHVHANSVADFGR